jgi:hypothetical protein
VYPTFYAECLTAPQAVSKYTDATSPVNGEIEGSYQIGGAQISCPTGQLLTGGGFAFDGSAYVWDYRPQISCPGVSLLTGGGYSNDQDAFTSAYISLPSNSDTWEIAVENNTDNTDTLTINAVCISFN